MQYLQLDIITIGDVDKPYEHAQLPISLVLLHDVIVISVMYVPCCVGVWYPFIVV